MTEQRCFTDARIVVHGQKAVRRPGKRADYILRYTRDFAIAMVEAKPEDEHAAKGLQQAKDYAEVHKLKFAYATNGWATTRPRRGCSHRSISPPGRSRVTTSRSPSTALSKPSSRANAACSSPPL